MSRVHSAVSVVVVVCAVAAPSASAQTRSSFRDLDALAGVVVDPVGPLSYEVVVSPGATLVYQGNLYTINSVFGFWILSDSDLTPSNASFLDPDGATWHTDNSNSGPGGIAGWDINPNSGIFIGDDPVTFAFNALTGSPDGYGFHIRVNETLPFGGNTAYFTAPSPGAGALVGLAGLIAARRRR